METNNNNKIKSDPTTEICQHMQLLGHTGFGVTELRAFEPTPLVAYADSDNSVVKLATELDGKTSGIYIGVQPRPLELFENAPNCWKKAVSNPKTNCGCDRDIEFITACFFDIDVVSTERTKGHPATEKELQQSLQAAIMLSRENGLAFNSSICCSGNGHYVLAPVMPIAVDSNEIADKFKQFCSQLVEKIAPQISGIKIDPVYNLSRVMRLMGTLNNKGKPSKDRPHRRARFITEPIVTKSMALHHMILNTEVVIPARDARDITNEIECNLTEIEGCEFMKWCRQYPMDVSEPQWFAMITNLAHLNGGSELIHEISRLDMFRYNHRQTERLIERVQARGYKPANCKTIRDNGFYCSKFGQCKVKAPMYLT